MSAGGKQLSEWVKRRGISGRAAAREIGIHWTYLSQICNGLRTPGLDSALNIEDHTGIPVRSWRPEKTTRVGKSKQAPKRSTKRTNGDRA